MKKVLIIMLMTMIMVTGCSIEGLKGSVKKVEEKVEKTIEKIPLMEFGDYKDIVINNIDSIDYIRLTEGGSNSENITNIDKIREIYNNLKNKNVGQETNRACDDNTTIYSFNMKNGKKIKIEIECDWLVIGNKRYEIK